jgi:hypothetical protein
MINTYNLFAAPVVHTKMPISFDIHKKIISFVENNYTEDNLRSIVNGFQFHEDFDGKEELDNNLNIFLKNNITFTRDSNIFELKPTLFDLIIFPNELLHYVLPENRSEKRISFAFNSTIATKGE